MVPLTIPRAAREEISAARRRPGRGRAGSSCDRCRSARGARRATRRGAARCRTTIQRSEEHTSELQSQSNLVCRLLLEKKNKTGPGSTLLRHLTLPITLSPNLHSPSPCYTDPCPLLISRDRTSPH